MKRTTAILACMILSAASTSARAFPARAGMNRSYCLYPIALRGVPRTRGDEPRDESINASIDARSPHARG